MKQQDERLAEIPEQIPDRMKINFEGFGTFLFIRADVHAAALEEAVAEEMEACAQIAEREFSKAGNDVKRQAGSDIADAIRARSEK